MARINLLPWREWERERRKNEFLANLLGVVVFGLGLVFVAGWYFDGQISNQTQRNAFLQNRIETLNKQIDEIKDLNQQRERLLARMRVIQALQGNRPVIVRVFDEMVQTLAKGVHYTSLSMTGNTLSVQGTAESNNRISALMRNLDGSSWFADPNLKNIKELPDSADYGDQAANFELKFVQHNRSADGEES